MKTNNPKVSIIIPSFNRERYIIETLKCVQSIDYNNFECIIVDNTSTDNSVNLINEFIKLDSRFSLITGNENLISSSRNRAILASTGKYILPLDSDDLIHPDYIEEAVYILESEPDVAVVTCNAVFFGLKRGKWKLPEYDFSKFIITNSLHNSSVYRRIDFDRTEGYKVELIVREDWEFWINLLKTGQRVVRIPKTYFFYRRHKDSIMKKYWKSMEVNKAFQIIYNYHSELYTPYLNNPIILLKEYNKYKISYNLIRRLTFRKPIE